MIKGGFYVKMFLYGNFLDKEKCLISEHLQQAFFIAPKRTILLQSIRLYNARNNWVRI